MDEGIALTGGQIIGLVLGSSAIAAVVTGVVSLLTQRLVIGQQNKVLDQQRLTENTRLMMSLFTVAHGRPSDGRTSTGLGENVGAIYALQSLADEFPPLDLPIQAFTASLANRSDDAAVQDAAGRAMNHFMSRGKQIRDR